VILDQLVLENVGVFAGRNEIELAPSGPDKPVVLIGGMNGAGKTTLLEAIHLALYGPLADGSARRTGGYDAYLRSLIHQPAQGDVIASVELAFHAFTEGKSRSYRVRRGWRDTTTGIRETVQVTVDDLPDQVLTETWAEFIEGFLPRGIAGLFFFDGEQIESLANLDRSRQVLASALAALLGLDLVDRLNADLAVLRRRRRSADVPDELRHRIEQTKAALDMAREQERIAFEAETEAKMLEDRAAKHSTDAEERYRANGGDLFDQKIGFESRVAELTKEREAIDGELRELAAGVLPFAQVARGIRELAAQAHRESEGAREQVVLDVLGGRDRALLDELRRSGAEPSVLKAVNAFLDGDRHQRRMAASTEPITGLASSAAADFLADRMLPDAQSKVEVLLSRRAEVDAQLEGAQRLLEGVPDPEALAPLRKAYDEERENLRQAHAAFVRAEERHKTLVEQRERALAAHHKAIDVLTEAGLSADDDRRFVNHADRVRATLDGLKVAATRRHVDRIAALVLDSLRTLMRKDNLITEITIDPATYAVELRGATGQPISSEQLSVGERQMLAVALLWGLARAAGQPLPVVIDTPLGRLDSSHRNHLLDRYFPYASHQVILLSTDTEINSSAWQQLMPHIGRSYRLEFDQGASATTVRPGYFWES
jgi:DNA sulfur modification protein DndD